MAERLRIGREEVAARLMAVALVGYLSLSSGCASERTRAKDEIFTASTPVLIGGGPRPESTVTERAESQFQGSITAREYLRSEISPTRLANFENEVQGQISYVVEIRGNLQESKSTKFTFVKTKSGESYVAFPGEGEGDKELLMKYMAALTQRDDGKTAIEYFGIDEEGNTGTFMSYVLSKGVIDLEASSNEIQAQAYAAVSLGEIEYIMVANPRLNQTIVFSQGVSRPTLKDFLQAVSPFVVVQAQEPENPKPEEAVYTATPTPTDTLSPIVVVTPVGVFTPTATVEPTETVKPTKTLEPTKTVEPTKSPTPVPTREKPTPTVEIKSEYITEVVRVGESALGNPIEVELIGQAENPQAPIVWFIANIHPGEGTAERANLLRKWYLENPETWRGFRLAFSNVNPDGKGRTNPNGIDLNRNADFDWEEPEGPGDKCSAQGSAPESEPETKAIMNAADELKNRGEVVFSIVFHARGEIIDPFVCPDSNSGSCAVSKIVARELGFSYMEVWRAYGCEDGHPQGLAGQVDDALAQKKGLLGCTLEHRTYEIQPGEAVFVGGGLMRALNSYFYP